MEKEVKKHKKKKSINNNKRDVKSNGENLLLLIKERLREKIDAHKTIATVVFLPILILMLGGLFALLNTQDPTNNFIIGVLFFIISCLILIIMISTTLLNKRKIIKKSKKNKELIISETKSFLCFKKEDLKNHLEKKLSFKIKTTDDIFLFDCIVSYVENIKHNRIIFFWALFLVGIEALLFFISLILVYF